ncbi:YDG/SRA domain-containing protein [Streptomyces sp. GC420]|uniref:YDG/SRA domain-containing protein n=1 Tax=Streptomyces sp. GC420 TaxID=2697568 RepID=UPI001414EDB4|nr:YDG/SRA domain-containing protein [Streptomyces sp. GC420]NBM16788.1 hypothetical protein [Streptomyces sp. GC420]
MLLIGLVVVFGGTDTSDLTALEVDQVHDVTMVNRSTTVKFGSIDGVSEGDWFESHVALNVKGVHRQSGSGISGTPNVGADSIVLSGGYVDDADRGNEIIYTGMGGRDRDTGRMVEDQSLATRGNAALVMSQALGKPVRVIEGLKIRGKKRLKATGGYRYRGLYRVAEHWETIGIEGFRICQFRLLKIGPGETIPRLPVDPLGFEVTDVEEQARRYIMQERLARDTAVTRRVKALHNDTCQICNLRMLVSPAGVAYSEAAHIQALGKPHCGPDVIENVLCLCPNCHARFDRGALHISDDLNVIDGLTLKCVGRLRSTVGHEIGIQFVRQHRRRWRGRSPELA